jgi:hypothetical protein
MYRVFCEYDLLNYIKHLSRYLSQSGGAKPRVAWHLGMRVINFHSNYYIRPVSHEEHAAFADGQARLVALELAAGTSQNITTTVT